MHKILTYLFSLLFITHYSSAQVLPKEGGSLNYRIIGFEFPAIEGDVRLEVAKGNVDNEDSFEKGMIISKEAKANKIIAEVPAFGTDYTWRVKSSKDKQAAKQFHHFSTATIPNVDSSLTRLRVLEQATAYKDAYVFIDGTRALYDMQGQPVWFLPNIWHFPSENFELRDLKQTPQGTVTFMMGDSAFEVNYNAEVLWRAPNNGTVSGGPAETYHHQLTRLANGHYMVLGTQLIPADSIMNGNGKPNARIPFGTVIEYDVRGRVAWSWKSWDYFRGSDIAYHKNERGVPDATTHENAFFFDEQKQVIYVSFRNISRIVKIKYPEGNVLATYGETFRQGVAEQGNGLYCHQHSCRVSDSGYLYLFNNDLCNAGAAPTVIKMRETAGRLEKIWEYTCNTDDADTANSKMKLDFRSGGNVVELPGHNILASMSALYYTRAFIVGADKKIRWRAAPERKDPNTGKWMPISIYSCNIINGEQELARFVWPEL